MIRVRFDPTKLTGEKRTWWDAWEAKSEAARDKYIAEHEAGEESAFKKGIWSELKAWLLDNIFHGKCAYCEVHVTAGFFGDAEHFRPKGNVTVTNDGRRQPAQLATGGAHSGYYWLAYDWRNLLPSCERCNNTKRDEFPVGKDHTVDAAKTTGELNGIEEPLLIYPYEDDPSRFIRFGGGGMVVAIDDDPKGVETIRVFGLDREALNDARWRAQGNAIRGLQMPVAKMLDDDVYNMKATNKEVDYYIGPDAPFSCAVTDWFIERARIVKNRLDKATQRLRSN